MKGLLIVFTQSESTAIRNVTNIKLFSSDCVNDLIKLSYTEVMYQFTINLELQKFADNCLCFFAKGQYDGSDVSIISKKLMAINTWTNVGR